MEDRIQERNLLQEELDRRKKENRERIVVTEERLRNMEVIMTTPRSMRRRGLMRCWPRRSRESGRASETTAGRQAVVAKGSAEWKVKVYFAIFDGRGSDRMRKKKTFLKTAQVILGQPVRERRARDSAWCIFLAVGAHNPNNRIKLNPNQTNWTTALNQTWASTSTKSSLVSLRPGLASWVCEHVHTRIKHMFKTYFCVTGVCFLYMYVVNMFWVYIFMCASLAFE